MKQYVIDGLRPDDLKKIKKYLDGHYELAPLGGIYWVKLEKKILTSLQKEHEDCQPHVFALVLEKDFLAAEFLVRVKTSIKCDCMGYANYEQQGWLMEKIDLILEELGIQI